MSPDRPQTGPACGLRPAGAVGPGAHRERLGAALSITEAAPPPLPLGHRRVHLPGVSRGVEGRTQMNADEHG